MKARQVVVLTLPCDDRLAFEQIKAVMRTAMFIGGFNRLDELLGLVKKVGGLREFEDLLGAMSPELEDIWL